MISSCDALPVYALFRAGDLHHLLDDLVQQLPLHGVGRACNRPPCRHGGSRAARSRASERRWCETAGLDMSSIAAMLMTHSSRWLSSQKMRTRVGSLELAEQLRTRRRNARVVRQAPGAAPPSCCVRAVVVRERKLRHMAVLLYPFWKFRSPVWKQNVQNGLDFSEQSQYTADVTIKQAFNSNINSNRRYLDYEKDLPDRSRLRQLREPDGGRCEEDRGRRGRDREFHDAEDDR